MALFIQEEGGQEIAGDRMDRESSSGQVSRNSTNV